MSLKPKGKYLEVTINNNIGKYLNLWVYDYFFLQFSRKNLQKKMLFQQHSAIPLYSHVTRVLGKKITNSMPCKSRIPDLGNMVPWYHPLDFFCLGAIWRKQFLTENLKFRSERILLKCVKILFKIFINDCKLALSMIAHILININFTYGLIC